MRIRIYVKVLPFYKPCVYARNLNAADLQRIPPALDVISGFTGGVISYTLG